MLSRKTDITIKSSWLNLFVCSFGIFQHMISSCERVLFTEIYPPSRYMFEIISLTITDSDFDCDVPRALCIQYYTTYPMKCGVCTQFCYALYCCGYVMSSQLLIYLPIFFSVASLALPVKLRWRIWVSHPLPNQTQTRQSMSRVDIV